MRSITQTFSDRFWRNNAIYFSGTLIAGALNYVYYPVLGRLMPLQEYGEVQALFSILLNVAIFFNALGIVIIQLQVSIKEPAKRQVLIAQVEWLATLLFSAILLIWLACAPLLVSFLQLRSTLPVVLLAFCYIASLFISFRQSLLQAEQHFVDISVAAILAAANKLVLSVLFVMAGFGVAGAIVGLLLGQLMTLAWVHYKTHRYGLGNNPLQARKLEWPELTPVLRYGALVLAATLTTVFFQTFDMIAVKHYFNPELSGAYAGIAAVGRIQFFVTGFIAAVMLPSVSPRHSRRSNRHTLYRSIALHLLLGGGVLSIFTLLPEFAIRLLVGQGFVGAAPILPLLSAALFLVALNNILLLYLLALRQWAIWWYCGLSVSGLLLLTGLRHSAPQIIVQNIIWISVALCALLCIHVACTNRLRPQAKAQQ